MKKTIGFCEFYDTFNKLRPDNFSYDSLHTLFDYLESYEDDTGEELELDVIALCCEYSEYENIEEFQKEYGTDYETIEDIEQETIVIKVDDNRFMIQQF